MSPFHSWLLIATVAVVIAAGCYLDWRRIQRNHRQARELRARAAVRRAEKACQR